MNLKKLNEELDKLLMHELSTATEKSYIAGRKKQVADAEAALERARSKLRNAEAQVHGSYERRHLKNAQKAGEVLLKILDFLINYGTLKKGYYGSEHMIYYLDIPGERIKLTDGKKTMNVDAMYIWDYEKNKPGYIRFILDGFYSDDLYYNYATLKGLDDSLPNLTEILNRLELEYPDVAEKEKERKRKEDIEKEQKEKEAQALADSKPFDKFLQELKDKYGSGYVARDDWGNVYVYNSKPSYTAAISGSQGNNDDYYQPGKWEGRGASKNIENEFVKAYKAQYRKNPDRGQDAIWSL